MFKKLVFILAVAALVVSAGTVPTAGHYRVTLAQSAAVQGTVLKAGDYRVNVLDGKATFIPEVGKTPVEAAVKVETVEKKFDETVVQISTATGKPVISEIRMGGTKTKLIFN